MLLVFFYFSFRHKIIGMEKCWNHFLRVMSIVPFNFFGSNVHNTLNIVRIYQKVFDHKFTTVIFLRLGGKFFCFLSCGLVGIAASLVNCPT